MKYSDVYLILQQNIAFSQQVCYNLMGDKMIGEKLKAIRISKKISINTVSEKTGITNSRLSKIERGIIPYPSLDDINAILKVYEVPLLSVLCEEGYCDKRDGVLKNLELLSDFEINHIQAEIDFILKEKGMENGI